MKASSPFVGSGKMVYCVKGCELKERFSLRDPKYPWIIQEQIIPQLNNNKKYDIRYHVILAYTPNDIYAWIWHEGYTRTCPDDFDPCSTEVSKQITNTSIHGCSHLQIINTTQQAADIMIQTLNIAKPTLDQHGKYGFVPLGYDFLIDDNNNLFLIEVNAQPTIDLTVDSVKDMMDEVLNFNLPAMLHYNQILDSDTLPLVWHYHHPSEFSDTIGNIHYLDPKLKKERQNKETSLFIPQNQHPTFHPQMEQQNISTPDVVNMESQQSQPTPTQQISVEPSQANAPSIAPRPVIRPRALVRPKAVPAPPPVSFPQPVSQNQPLTQTVPTLPQPTLQSALQPALQQTPNPTPQPTLNPTPIPTPQSRVRFQVPESQLKQIPSSNIPTHGPAQKITVSAQPRSSNSITSLPDFEEWKTKLLKFLDQFLAPVIKTPETRAKILESKWWPMAFMLPTTNASENYQILEFQGDMLIKGFMGNYLIDKVENHDANSLSNLSNFYVANERWEPISDKVGFPDHMYVPKGTRVPGAAKADVFEAFFGALYRAGNEVRPNFGYPVAHSMFYHLMNIYLKIDLRKARGAPKTIVNQIFSRFQIRNKELAAIPNDLRKKVSTLVEIYSSSPERVFSLYLRTAQVEFLEQHGINLTPVRNYARTMEEARRNQFPHAPPLNRNEGELLLGQAKGEKGVSEPIAYDIAERMLESVGVTTDWAMQLKREMDVSDTHLSDIYPEAMEIAKELGYSGLYFEYPRKTKDAKSGIVDTEIQLTAFYEDGSKEILAVMHTNENTSSGFVRSKRELLNWFIEKSGKGKGKGKVDG